MRVNFRKHSLTCLRFSPCPEPEQAKVLKAVLWQEFKFVPYSLLGEKGYTRFPRTSPLRQGSDIYFCGTLFQILHQYFPQYKIIGK